MRGKYGSNSLIEKFLVWLSDQKERSENTINNYRIDLETFEKYILSKNITITEVSEEDIEGFKSYMLNEKKWASSTRARRVVAIRIFYEYLTSKNYIQDNPAINIEVPKIPNRAVSYLTQKQAVELIETTESQNEPYKSRDRLILVLFLSIGLRVNELTNIKLSDITGNRLRIIGKGNKERFAVLNDDVLEALDDYLKVRPNVDTDYLFISERKRQMSKRTIQYTVDKYLNKAKFNTEQLSSHSLRHSAATIMHKNGTDIKTLQELLGHTKVETTAKIYTHIDFDQLEQASQSTQGIFTKNK